MDEVFQDFDFDIDYIKGKELMLCLNNLCKCSLMYQVIFDTLN